MKKLSALSLLAPLLVGGCLSIDQKVDRMVNGENPYSEPPFYARYLTNDSARDRAIAQNVEALRLNPNSAPLHNNLGMLLLERGFPKDAEREFRRAIAADHDLYAAWYNLGLLREARGEWGGAASAFEQTIDLKPGHPAAHFQLGLLYEKRGKTDAAIDHYARAFAINRALLDARVNPRILDTKLISRALLRNYEHQHTAASIRFQATPSGLTAPAAITVTPETATPEDGTAPSPEAPPSNIVTPSPPPTDPSQQPPSTPSTLNQQPPPPAKPSITSLPRWDVVPNATPPAETPPPPEPPANP